MRSGKNGSRMNLLSYDGHSTKSNFKPITNVSNGVNLVSLTCFVLSPSNRIQDFYSDIMHCYDLSGKESHAAKTKTT